MKILLTIFAIWICCGQSLSQDRWFFSLDYTPTYSKFTYPYKSQDFDNTHQLFVKAGYGISRKTTLIIGLGYLNVNEMTELHLNGQLDIDLISSIIRRNYIMAPIGIKHYFGTFFINPEIGFGWNVYDLGPPVRQTSYLTNGDVVENRYNDTFTPRDFKRLAIPAFLSIGKEFYLSKTTLLVGLKGYHSLVGVRDWGFNKQHYFGLGASIGVRL